MAAGLVLEFDGADQGLYERVNDALGIDMTSGGGDWPAGLLSHAAGPGERGWMVIEVWESRDAQRRFMDERLGAALQKGGITGPPSRVEWVDLIAYHTPEGQAAAR